MEWDCDGGERMRSRRGLATDLGVIFEGVTGDSAVVKAVVGFRHDATSGRNSSGKVAF